ncbi:uncharacterized protein TNCV_4151231 [Trichonephila clavipes]|nr:uncharacterized protein TNCV_4151231 [Trichonephila clavipes]
MTCLPWSDTLTTGLPHTAPKIIPNFDIRDGNIVLFLTLFERQEKRIGVEKTNWVSALLARMPSDITQLIARESEDKFDNYDYIKGVLLKKV